MPENTLSTTAYWTAAVRALENERSERLFADPWAGALAGETGKAWIRAHTAWPGRRGCVSMSWTSPTCGL
jgi:O-methyltransferase involved in polyketide biosynthesis